MPHPYRYQDFIDEQRKGLVHGVFIDDSGSPGLHDTPTNLHPRRKSWVSVIVPRSVIAEVWNQLPQALHELQQLTRAGEFHFADIYAGRRAFKGLSLDQRLGVFRFMAYIFSVYRFPTFVQTLDPKSLANVRSRAAFPERLGPFNLNKHEDLSLLFLIFRVKHYIEQTYPEGERRARLFVDEGFQRDGAAVVIPNFERIFADGLICFGRSDSILPLQLADFAAFSLNRTQLLIGRPNLSELDKTFLEIIQPVAQSCQNLPRLNLSDWFPERDPTFH